jgi:hypothetical protein
MEKIGHVGEMDRGELLFTDDNSGLPVSLKYTALGFLWDYGTKAANILTSSPEEVLYMVSYMRERCRDNGFIKPGKCPMIVKINVQKRIVVMIRRDGSQYMLMTGSQMLGYAKALEEAARTITKASPLKEPYRLKFYGAAAE